MKIKIDPHALVRGSERGASEGEIEDAVNTGFDIPAKYGHFGKAKVYEFKKKRQNKYYEQKRIEVFYTVEAEIIVIITVYVFYGKWEE